MLIAFVVEGGALVGVVVGAARVDLGGLGGGEGRPLILFEG